MHKIKHLSQCVVASYVSNGNVLSCRVNCNYFSISVCVSVFLLVCVSVCLWALLPAINLLIDWLIVHSWCAAVNKKVCMLPEMFTIPVKTSVNTIPVTILWPKSVADAAFEKNCQYQYQYFCDSILFTVFTFSNVHFFPRSSINTVNKMPVVEKMAKSLLFTVTWC